MNIPQAQPQKTIRFKEIFSGHSKEYWIAFLFILPAFINFILFRYWPLITTLHASLWDYSLLGGFGDFVGLKHYQRMLNDPIFWKSMQVTIAYVLMRIPLQTALALLLAIFLSEQSMVNKVVRSAVFTPIVISTIVASTLWALMYHSQIGLFNSVLASLGFEKQPFLTSTALALPSVTAMLIWKEIGFSIIVLMAGLKGIPNEYKEAAVVDGANRIQIFFHITIPLMKRVLMYVLVSQTIFAFQVFVPIYSMTQGGPQNATKVIVYYIYQMGFKFADMGYANALSFVLVMFLLVISLIQMRLLRSDVEI